MFKLQGRIIKIDSGFFYIYREDKIYECKLRGKLKVANDNLYVGDNAEFTIFDNNYGIIEKILKRNNLIDRPKIANVDQLFIVMSLGYPKIDYNVLDRILILSRRQGVKPVIILNKYDQGVEAELIEIKKTYKDYDLLFTSTKTGEGIEELKSLIKGKLSVFAGPSGVGKSSLLNVICGKIMNLTGSLGLKIHRGKHTTRTSQLYNVAEGLIADTPGFSRVDFPKDMKMRELPELYHEYKIVSQNCKFNGCLHYHEKNCAVKSLVSEGLLSQDRYDRYIYFLNELKEIEERRYK